MKCKEVIREKMTKILVSKKLTKFGNGYYVLIPRSILTEWAGRLKVKIVKVVQLKEKRGYVEIKPLKEK